MVNTIKVMSFAVLLCSLGSGCYEMADLNEEYGASTVGNESVFYQDDDFMVGQLAPHLDGTWRKENGRDFETDVITFINNGVFNREQISENLKNRIYSSGYWSTWEDDLELITPRTPPYDTDVYWVRRASTVLVKESILYWGVFLRQEKGDDSLDGTWFFLEKEGTVRIEENSQLGENENAVHELKQLEDIIIYRHELVVEKNAFKYTGYHYTKKPTVDIEESEKVLYSGSIWSEGPIVYSTLPTNTLPRHLDQTQETVPLGIRVSKNIIYVSDTPNPIPEENGYKRID